MKQYIYLDDVRTPTQGVGEDNQPWVVVRSYDEFVEKVNEIGLENIQTVNNDRTKSNPSVDLQGVDAIPVRKTGMPPLPVKENAPIFQPNPNQEKEKKGPPINKGLTIPGISSQGIGSSSPQTAPVVKAPISTSPSKVEAAPIVQVKPVTPTTVEKFVVPTPVTKVVPPAPELRLDSKQSLPPKPTIPGLPNSLTLQGKLAKKKK